VIIGFASGFSVAKNKHWTSNLDNQSVRFGKYINAFYNWQVMPHLWMSKNLHNRVRSLHRRVFFNQL